MIWNKINNVFAIVSSNEPRYFSVINPGCACKSVKSPCVFIVFLDVLLAIFKISFLYYNVNLMKWSIQSLLSCMVLCLCKIWGVCVCFYRFRQCTINLIKLENFDWVIVISSKYCILFLCIHQFMYVKK